MKSVFGVLILLVFATLSFLAINNTKHIMPSETLIQVTPIEHATGILEWSGSAIYFDPTGGAEAFAGQPLPHVVLVTDIHGDHLSTSTLEAVTREDVTLIVPQAVKELLPETLANRAIVLANGESTESYGFTFTATPMYNHPDAENANFHVKGRGNGYLIERDGKRVYIAGDTAGTEEMRALKNIDIAFIPMNLPYTMDMEEAADAVLAFKPKVVYPYHFRGQDGFSDVNVFKQIVTDANPDIEVIIGDWYQE